MARMAKADSKVEARATIAGGSLSVSDRRKMCSEGNHLTLFPFLKEALGITPGASLYAETPTSPVGCGDLVAPSTAARHCPPRLSMLSARAG